MLAAVYTLMLACTEVGCFLHLCQAVVALGAVLTVQASAALGLCMSIAAVDGILKP